MSGRFVRVRANWRRRHPSTRAQRAGGGKETPRGPSAAEQEQERGCSSWAGSGRAEMPYKLKKEKVSVALFPRVSALGPARSSGRGPSQARDSPRQTLPSGPRMTPRGQPSAPAAGAPPASAPAGKRPITLPGIESPDVHLPLFLPPPTPGPAKPPSKICPAPGSLPGPPLGSPCPPPIWDSPSLKAAPPSRTAPFHTLPRPALPLRFPPLLARRGQGRAGLLHCPLQPLLPARQAL